jgi:hypothetical protein
MYNSWITQLFDAYLTGKITNDGELTDFPPRRIREDIQQTCQQSSGL